MTLDDLHFLLSPEGEQLLRDLAGTNITPENHLQLASRLRRQVSPPQAQAVLETALLRQLATSKFSRAEHMFFTRPALEQASSEVVSAYRMRRYSDAGFEQVVDLGCGIGGDALALAAQANVVGVEWDAVRLAMAQENVRVYERGQRFHPLQADLLSLTPLPADALFFDPSRRDEYGRRFYSVHDYQPPLSLIHRWREQTPHAAVKISPGVDYAELPAEAEIEFVSVKGEVKEGILWFGALRSGAGRRATLLPAGYTLTDDGTKGDTVPVTSPRSYLYEPDKAVIRAHLIEALAHRLEATKIDDEIAYLTTETPEPTPFARCFAIEATFPFQLKRLRHYLRQHRVGRVTIKKRGSPLDPDRLRQRLRLHGSQHRTVFLTHAAGEATVLIGQTLNEG